MAIKGYLGLATLPILGVAVAVVAEYFAVFASPTGAIKTLVDSCEVPSRQKLRSDITAGSLPEVDNFFCMIVPFFQMAVESRLNVGLLTILMSVMTPLLTRLTYQAVSPNRKTALFGAVPLFIIAAIGQVVGFGIMASSFGTLVYTIGSILAYKRTSPAVAPVPTAANSIYLCNLASMITGGLVVVMLVTNRNSDAWFYTQIAFQFFPLLLLPIVMTSASTPLVNTEKAAREELRQWDAEGVSYSFERTWSYYRKFGGLSTIMYWYGINRIIRGVWNEGDKYTDATQFFICDIAATTFLLLALVVLDKLTIRSKAARHPISGAPRSTLDVECDQAIARAPAASPWLEKTWTGFLVATLFGGPGLAAALWWSSGEEELGWKSRKAWRDAIAVEGKKEK